MRPIAVLNLSTFLVGSLTTGAAFGAVVIPSGDQTISVAINSPESDGGAGSGASAGFWSKGVAAAPAPANDYKVFFPGTGYTIDNGATLQFSFDARYTDMASTPNIGFSLLTNEGDGEKPFLNMNGFPSGNAVNDGTWHHYSLTFTVTDSAGTVSDPNQFLITDFLFGPSDPSGFTVEFDNMSLLDVNTNEQHFLPQVGATVNQNAHMDNGGALSELFKPTNGIGYNFADPTSRLFVVPEPSSIAVLAIAGLLAFRRR